MLIDGYNIIFAWEELKKAAEESLDLAREILINRLSNYCGYAQCELILVFDAYKVKGGIGSVEKVNNINVVYTKEAETADAYIEKVTHELAKKHRVRVATSDGLEQIIILGGGAQRVSASEFEAEIAVVYNKDIQLTSKAQGKYSLRNNYDNYLIRSIDYEDQFFDEIGFILKNYGIELMWGCCVSQHPHINNNCFNNIKQRIQN